MDLGSQPTLLAVQGQYAGFVAEVAAAADARTCLTHGVAHGSLWAANLFEHARGRVRALVTKDEDADVLSSLDGSVRSFVERGGSVDVLLSDRLSSPLSGVGIRCRCRDGVDAGFLVSDDAFLLRTGPSSWVLEFGSPDDAGRLADAFDRLFASCAP